MGPQVSHWQIHDEFFDHASGMHVVIYRNRHSGERNLLQIMTKVGCPTCGHVQVLDSLGDIDIPATKAAHLENLNAIHENELAHAAKHGIRTKCKS